MIYLTEINQHKITFEGIVLSKVKCNNERKVYAQKVGKKIEEIPIRFGSLRLGVNNIIIDNKLHVIDKMSERENLSEERLLLEISYRYKGNESLIEEHEVIDEIEVGNNYSITINSTFISKNHYSKILPIKNGNIIKSYFIKAWADEIYFIDEVSKKMPTNKITPLEIIKRVAINNVLKLNPVY